MKVLVSALEGSLVFFVLLVTQILIVASLTLTAIWLYFKRLREENTVGLPLTEETELNNPESSPLFVQPSQTPTSSGSNQNLELSQALDEEKAKVRELQKTQELANEKITGLESQVREYEILKHEIGQLGELKLENENLKAEMGRLKETATVTEVKPQLVEAKVEASSKEVPMEPEAILVPSTSNLQPPDSVTIVGVPPADLGLEGLLSEIEALTSEKKDSVKKSA